MAVVALIQEQPSLLDLNIAKPKPNTAPATHHTGTSERWHKSHDACVRTEIHLQRQQRAQREANAEHQYSGSGAQDMHRVLQRVAGN